MANDGGDNPYLVMREAKIARNLGRLRELGLEPPAKATVAARTSPATVVASRKRTAASPIVVAVGPTRRSSRLSSQTRPDYKDVTLPSVGEAGRKRPRSSPQIDAKKVLI